VTRRSLATALPAALLVVALALAVAGAAPAGQPARQISFGKWNAGEDVVFDYRIADLQGREQRLGFRIAQAAIDEARRLIQPYSNAAMAASVEAALRAYLRREAPDIAADFRRDGNAVDIHLNGPDRNRLQQVERLLDDRYRAAAQDFLQQRYMRQVDKTIYLDYARLAQHYTEPLRPLARAIAGLAGDTDRDRLALVLAFFQTMPYDALTDHDVSNGIDFLAPPVLLDLNRGDCDSKAVALGAVLHSLLPGRKLIIVILPRHAIVGIDLPLQGDDRSLTYQGRRYVLMETAGPGVYPIGTLFPDTDRAVRDGHIELVSPL
jgi:hypothetical protein